MGATRALALPCDPAQSSKQHYCRGPDLLRAATLVPAYRLYRSRIRVLRRRPPVNFTSSAPSITGIETPKNGHSGMYPFPEPASTPSKRGLYLQMFWDHRRFFLRAGICALLASTLIAFLVPDRYKAKVQLM